MDKSTTTAGADAVEPSGGGGNHAWFNNNTNTNTNTNNNTNPNLGNNKFAAKHARPCTGTNKENEQTFMKGNEDVHSTLLQRVSVSVLSNDDEEAFSHPQHPGPTNLLDRHVSLDDVIECETTAVHASQKSTNVAVVGSAGTSPFSGVDNPLDNSNQDSGPAISGAVLQSEHDYPPKEASNEKVTFVRHRYPTRRMMNALHSPPLIFSESTSGQSASSTDMLSPSLFPPSPQSSKNKPDAGNSNKEDSKYSSTPVKTVKKTKRHKCYNKKLRPNKPIKTTLFPFKLARFLRENCPKHPDKVYWTPDGKAFFIHTHTEEDQQLIGKLVSPIFAHGNHDALRRQLNLYSFVRLPSGPYKGAWYHENFHREHLTVQHLAEIKVGCRSRGNTPLSARAKKSRLLTASLAAPLASNDTSSVSGHKNKTTTTPAAANHLPSSTRSKVTTTPPSSSKPKFQKRRAQKRATNSKPPIQAVKEKKTPNIAKKNKSHAQQQAKANDTSTSYQKDPPSTVVVPALLDPRPQVPAAAAALPYMGYMPYDWGSRRCNPYRPAASPVEVPHGPTQQQTVKCRPEIAKTESPTDESAAAARGIDSNGGSEFNVTPALENKDNGHLSEGRPTTGRSPLVPEKEPRSSPRQTGDQQVHLEQSAPEKPRNGQTIYNSKWDGEKLLRQAHLTVPRTPLIRIQNPGQIPADGRAGAAFQMTVGGHVLLSPVTATGDLMDYTPHQTKNLGTTATPATVKKNNTTVTTAKSARGYFFQRNRGKSFTPLCAMIHPVESPVEFEPLEAPIPPDTFSPLDVDTASDVELLLEMVETKVWDM